jgi:hypothetical protein
MRVPILATIVLFMLGSASLVRAQAVPEEFTKAREARTMAIQNNDRAMFERYTMENFILIEPTGHIEGRAERAARMKPGTPPPTGQRPPRVNQRISIFNNDTIVVAWDQVQQGVLTHFLEAWVKDNGTWRAAGAHVSRTRE